MALRSGIQTYQILTNDDEVCIPSLSSILLAVTGFFLSFLCSIIHSSLQWVQPFQKIFHYNYANVAMTWIIVFTSLEESQNHQMKHMMYKNQTYHKLNKVIHTQVTARQESTTYINGFEFQFQPTSNVSKLNSKKSFCETNLGQNYLLWNAQFQRRRRLFFLRRRSQVSEESS